MTNAPPSQPGEAPHFTKEMLLDAMRHLRADFEASVSGKAADERARSRLEYARRLGLDKIAPESIAAIDQAIGDTERADTVLGAAIPTPTCATSPPVAPACRRPPDSLHR